jgi:hypothetical protein
MLEIFGMTRYVNSVYNALASPTAQQESIVGVGAMPMTNMKRLAHHFAKSNY